MRCQVVSCQRTNWRCVVDRYAPNTLLLKRKAFQVYRYRSAYCWQQQPTLCLFCLSWVKRWSKCHYSTEKKQTNDQHPAGVEPTTSWFWSECSTTVPAVMSVRNINSLIFLPNMLHQRESHIRKNSCPKTKIKKNNFDQPSDDKFNFPLPFLAGCH